MLLQDVPHLFFSGLGRGPLDWKLVSIVLVFMKDKKNCGNNRTVFFFFFQFSAWQNCEDYSGSRAQDVCGAPKVT